MKKIILSLCSAMLIVSCSLIPKDNVVSTDELSRMRNSAVRQFADLPTDLLGSLDRMGADGLSILNEDEGRYLNAVFNLSPDDGNLVGKKVAFLHDGALADKADYFNGEKDRFSRGYSPTGGMVLYLFDETQKEESGGYDASIVYWSKIVVPTNKVIKRLKGKNA